MSPSRLPTTPARPSPLGLSASEDRRRDDLSQAAQQAATGNHRTPHFGDRKSFRWEDAEGGEQPSRVMRCCGRTTLVMITAKAWPLVPSDRPGEFRPSCWAEREKLSSKLFSPAPKPLPSVCCFSDGPGPLANWTWRSSGKKAMERNYQRDMEVNGSACTRRRAPQCQQCAGHRFNARTLRPSRTDSAVGDPEWNRPP